MTDVDIGHMIGDQEHNKVTLQLDDYDLMKLWKIDISKFKPDFIEEQIKKEEVEELNPFNYLSNYFSDQAAADKSIIATTASLSRDIITKSIMSLVNLAEAYLENVHETYDWLKSLRRSSNKIATRK
ncbi:hypothetical protein RhiirA4_449521, partial [Rhizophagus irregularis]